MAKKKNTKTTKAVAKQANKAISKMGLVGIVVVLIIAIALVAIAFSPVGKSIATKISGKPDSSSNLNNSSKETKIVASNYAPIKLADEKLKVHFIDVMQGDGVYIELPDGKDMLIDGGSRTSTAATDRFVEYIGNIKGEEKKLDYLLVTHPDLDHYNMLKPILETYQVQNIYYYNVEKNPTYKGYIDLFHNEKASDTKNAALYDAGSSATEGVWQTIKYDDAENGYTLDMYSIGYDTLNTTKPEEYDAAESNGMSIVTNLEYKGKNVLLTGDATLPTEEWLIPQLGADYDCDVLKLGHHGSKTSTGEPFLDSIKPEYAIVSANDADSHRHPDSVVISRLYRRGIVTYSTYLHGHITLLFDSEGNFGFKTEVANMATNNTKPKDPLYIAPTTP